MTTKRHTEGLPQGFVRETEGLRWELQTDQFGEVWVPNKKTAWKIRYTEAYRSNIFGVNGCGCETWERAVSYSIKCRKQEYEQAKRVVAEYEET